MLEPEATRSAGRQVYTLACPFVEPLGVSALVIVDEALHWFLALTGIAQSVAVVAASLSRLIDIVSTLTGVKRKQFVRQTRRCHNIACIAFTRFSVLSVPFLATIVANRDVESGCVLNGFQEGDSRALASLIALLAESHCYKSSDHKTFVHLIMIPKIV